MKRRVTIVWRILSHYRVPFYKGLREYLSRAGIELCFIYGQGTAAEEAKKDSEEIGWAVKIRNCYFGPLVWQPCLEIIRGSDLVIVEQANKYLLNYLLLLKRPFTSQKIAFWGHGRNMQDSPVSLLNQFKKLYTTKCDWWFAYTKGVKQLLVSMGFAAEKITVVQNAIDTVLDRRHLESITGIEQDELKAALSIGKGPVAIYCGGLYKEKAIDLLVESCRLVQKEIPSFEVLVLGSGSDRHIVEAAAAQHSWFHYVGPKFGREKGLYFSIADVFLLPGAVGLAVLDSFALQVPMITTTTPFHGPEIEYLESGTNGLVTDMNAAAFSAGTVQLLNDKGKLLEMKKNCRACSEIYTIEKMAVNFGEGIKHCLDR